MSSMYVFTPKRGSPICHDALLTVQNTQLRALLFIGNRQFIEFLHKQNQAASTEMNLLSLIGPGRNGNLGETTQIYFFFFTFRSRTRLCRNLRKRVARGGKL